MGGLTINKLQKHEGEGEGEGEGEKVLERVKLTLLFAPYLSPTYTSAVANLPYPITYLATHLTLPYYVQTHPPFPTLIYLCLPTIYLSLTYLTLSFSEIKN